jgi:glyoxylase-like metal-dependent hydrolase (beta-lactamase superfamily II)
MGEQLMHKKEAHTLYFDVAPGVWGTKDIFVNMYMVQDTESGDWVLIDTGLKSSGSKIKKMAAELFGENSKPSAIILTHGHFDHVGSLKKLSDEWDVRIYCHYLELPYLSGKSDYPPADPSASSGLMAKASPLYPTSSINVEGKLHILPPDGSVPFLPEWKYIHTPGHAPGHVSFFRPKDKVLIAGDAFTTTIPESVMSVMTQKKKLSGPPKYFTYDWEAAHNSVKKLDELQPEIVATGHGQPMSGEQMQIDLTNLAMHFDELGIPHKGRYINDPAVIDAGGVKYVPPKQKISAGLLITVGLITFTAITAAYLLISQRKRKQEQFE